MATIEIKGWKKDFPGFTAFNSHAKTELKFRLRRGLAMPPAEVKRLVRLIHKRELPTLTHVQEEAVYGIVQILETMGADINLVLNEKDDSSRLFRRLPWRGGNPRLKARKESSSAL
ncbi:MAG: hypothetical protein ACO1QB_13540 [Verrucomicrobiales bacterium]